MNHEQAIAELRAQERDSLARLPERPSWAIHARTIIPISRDLYAQVEQPPTRHRSFAIRTEWQFNGADFVVQTHAVYVLARPGHRQVCDERPGLFGAQP